MNKPPILETRFVSLRPLTKCHVQGNETRSKSSSSTGNECKPVTEDFKACTSEQGQLNMTIASTHFVKMASLSPSCLWLLAPGSFATAIQAGESHP